MHPSVRSTPPGLAPARPSLRAVERSVVRIVVGTGPGADRVFADGDPAALVGLVADRHGTLPAAVRYLRTFDELPAILDAHTVSSLSLCLSRDEWFHLQDIVAACLERGVPVAFPVTSDAGDRGGMRAAAKRALDVVGAVTGLVVLGPALALTAAMVAMEDGRPVIFRQARAGRFGRPFTMVKFRTMRRDADAMRAALRARNEVAGGASFKLRNDPRVTRLGAWLRRTSVDEMPQLWNVLRGEMSLVGPRPHPYDDLAGYQAWHLARLAAKPGMTGLWQVELRGEGDFDEWVRKDLEYIERQSLRLDLAILLRTIPAVLRGSGR